jgi:hypothetical protein
VLESECAEYGVSSGFGACAPVTGTVRAVLDTLTGDSGKVSNTPDATQRPVELGMNVATTSRDEVATFMRTEAARWAKLGPDAGIPG